MNTRFSNKYQIAIGTSCMKNKVLVLGISAAIALGSCTGSADNKNENGPHGMPRPGTVVATMQETVLDDTLNHTKCTVKVIADSLIERGVYDVEAGYGPNSASGKFTMPKGGEDLIPILRKGNMPCSFIIGFKVAKDTTFYDYFEVICTRTATRMEYIKGYTF